MKLKRSVLPSIVQRQMGMKVKNKNTKAYTMLHCPPDSPLGSKRETDSGNRKTKQNKTNHRLNQTGNYREDNESL